MVNKHRKTSFTSFSNKELKIKITTKYATTHSPESVKVFNWTIPGFEATESLMHQWWQ
jgi:hypothetical protein